MKASLGGMGKAVRHMLLPPFACQRRQEKGLRCSWPGMAQVPPHLGFRAAAQLRLQHSPRCLARDARGALIMTAAAG